MKVGIITVQNGRNFGASLQAYALVKFLRNNNIDAYLIDYRTRKIEERMKSYDQIKRWNNPTNIKYNLKKYFKEIIFNSAQYDKQRKEKFENFHKQIFDMSLGSLYNCNDLARLNKTYDAFICGSDQIWNPDITDLDDAFFLAFANEGKRKIAYAPSLGMASEKVNSNLKAKLQKKLESVQYLSIREENNKKIVEELTDRKCTTTLDPVLLLEEEWEEVLELSENICINQPYAFYYPVINQPELEKFAFQEAKKRGWKLINPRLIPSYAKIKGYYPLYKNTIGPAEFVKLLSGAEAVFTNSFHATVFSSIFKKELFIRPLSGKHENRNNRINEYLKMINLYDYSKIDENNNIHLRTEDYIHVNDYLKKRRESSIEYLLDALQY